MERVQKLAVATKHAMNADGILLRQSSEEVAGQTRLSPAFPHYPMLCGAKNAARMSQTLHQMTS